MTFLEQYDAIDASQPAQKMALIFKYVRGEPDILYSELRANRPIFVTPAGTMMTRFADVQEVLSRARIFSVRLYAPKMDPASALSCWRAMKPRSIGVTNPSRWRC
jgi:hypothetical protein